ncbi:TRAC protein, partial [Polyodon spathula]|nr:TRAC protein [Polyodon spathula]
ESKTEAFLLGSEQDNKDGKVRACLITDFSSHNISVTLGGETFDADPSVIKGDKQYSVVAFLQESKERSLFICSADVNGSVTKGESNIASHLHCVDSMLNLFLSDEKLNSLSLVVLGLRVIFLKSIAFNVVMTIRAWMS